MAAGGAAGCPERTGSFVQLGMPPALNPVRPSNQTPAAARPSRARLRRLRAELVGLAPLLEACGRYDAADAAMILSAHLAEICVEPEAAGAVPAGGGAREKQPVR
jgi:hypothetical protein